MSRFMSRGFAAASRKRLEIKETTLQHARDMNGPNRMVDLSQHIDFI